MAEILQLPSGRLQLLIGLKAPRLAIASGAVGSLIPLTTENSPYRAFADPGCFPELHLDSGSNLPLGSGLPVRATVTPSRSGLHQKYNLAPL